MHRTFWCMVSSFEVCTTLLLPVFLQASTLPAWTGSAPGLKSSSDPVARVAAAGESAFNLTFSLDAAASIKFLVVHANMYARFGNNYAVYDNVVSGQHGGAACKVAMTSTCDRDLCCLLCCIVNCRRLPAHYVRYRALSKQLRLLLPLTALVLWLWPCWLAGP